MKLNHCSHKVEINTFVSSCSPRGFFKGLFVSSGSPEVACWGSIIIDRSHMECNIIKPWLWHSLSFKLTLSNKIQDTALQYTKEWESLVKHSNFSPDARNICQCPENYTFYEARELGCSPLLDPQTHSQRHYPFSLLDINFTLKDNPAEKKQGDFVVP